MKDNIIYSLEEEGNYITVENKIDTVEYEVEENTYQDPKSSWVELKVYDNYKEELAKIALSNSDAIYLARLILESVTITD